MWFLWLLVFAVLAYLAIGALGLIFASLNELFVPAAALALMIAVVWAIVGALEWLTGLMPAKVDEVVFEGFAVLFTLWLCGSWLHGIGKALLLAVRPARDVFRRRTSSNA